MTLAEKLDRARTERYFAELDKMSMEDFLQQNRLKLEHTIRTAKNFPRTPDRNHRVPAERKYSGWMLPILKACESLCWGRWHWHTIAWAFMKLPDGPIPQIEFEQAPNPLALKMIHASLNAIPNHGEWQTWGSWQYLDYFFDWLLFAFGHTAELPQEPEPNAYDRLYQVFCLEAMIAWPHDYFADIMAENKHGQHQGFYPTPHSLVDMMTRMIFMDREVEDGRDPRTQTVNEPCMGTGRMLLYASNHSVCLSGMDINATCVKATTVNGFLYAPWLVQPFAWIKPPPPPPKPPEPPRDFKLPVWATARRGRQQGEFQLV